ncbi:hypothetical protein KG892_03235 [Vermiphilus pyriformis]|uniref:Uncharacterized protein n=1 Tax=candidate division TM6 bacterium JCVI TM6SC1 TaxID=1306947 RepID=A0A0D2I2F1_9BACT|nr:hypothetical protein J120_00005 [candidate division TM6 bacterium JCVI TM6SC1]UNE34989.1 MAG: hypothetical protein KG892_03235 [Vermiphilus pyriformis]
MYKKIIFLALLFNETQTIFADQNSNVAYPKYESSVEVEELETINNNKFVQDLLLMIGAGLIGYQAAIIQVYVSNIPLDYKK